MKRNTMTEDKATVTKLLPADMQAALEEAARAEKRQPDDLVQEAVRQYLKDKHWQILLAYGQERTRALGYKPSDVNRLIAEHRRENSERGR